MCNYINRVPTPKYMKYGMLVIVLQDGGYHSGCKVHFFNEKGVLIGNFYQFLPYERIRLSPGNNFPRYFYNKKYEGVKSVLFGVLLSLTTRLLRFTQSKMD